MNERVSIGDPYRPRGVSRMAWAERVYSDVNIAPRIINIHSITHLFSHQTRPLRSAQRDTLTSFTRPLHSHHLA